MEYNFRQIEMARILIANNVYKVVEDESKPKYYVLICFLILQERFTCRTSGDILLPISIHAKTSAGKCIASHGI